MGSMRQVRNCWRSPREKRGLLRLLKFTPIAHAKVSTSGESVRFKQMERKFRERGRPGLDAQVNALVHETMGCR